jgi:hypothetical protein
LRKKKSEKVFVGVFDEWIGLFIKSVIKWHFYISKIIFHLDSNLTFFLLFFFSFKEMEEICLIVTALYANIKD